MFQNSLKLSPRPVRRTIASPSVAAEDDQQEHPGEDEPGRDHEHERDQPLLPERPRLDAVVGAVDRLDHRAHRAGRGPERDERCRAHEGDRGAALVLRGVLLGQVDHVEHAVRRDRADELLERVEGAGAEQPEQADQQDHRREEREQRAEGDLLAEAHAVVGDELLARALEDGEPLAPRELERARGRAALAVSVAVDKGERAEACFRPALPAAAHQEPHGRPDPAGDHEAGAERGGRGERQLAPAASRSTSISRRAGRRPRRRAARARPRCRGGPARACGR